MIRSPSPRTPSAASHQVPLPSLYHSLHGIPRSPKRKSRNTKIRFKEVWDRIHKPEQNTLSGEAEQPWRSRSICSVCQKPKVITKTGRGVHKGLLKCIIKTYQTSNDIFSCSTALTARPCSLKHYKTCLAQTKTRETIQIKRSLSASPS